ncbi:MAG: S8 family peptidase [Planctomycetota bacterium]|nr:S8 family peptidase [Planctomycetota bacterium]
MKSKYCYPLVGILSMAAAAWAQDATTQGEVSTETAAKVTPVTATSQLPGNVQVAEEDLRSEPQNPEATIVKVDLDDSIPLPIPAVIEASPEGDVVVEKASGNPFFLSFIAGPYTPPVDELVDPALLQMDGNFGDARPGNETYAMVMFQKRITDQRLEELKAMDCRILGFHPHYTIRVAIPVDRVLDVSTMDFVRWVGAPRTWQKVHPAMRGEVKGMSQVAPLDMYVSVFESDMNENSVAERFGSVSGVTPESSEPFMYEGTDARSIRHHSNGWMHQQLESMGMQVHEYRPDIDTFVVTGTVASVAAMTELDFVQFVEPVPVKEMFSAPMHDESIPMIMADETRSQYDGSTSSVAQVGIVDSGVETAHTDIDIFGWGWNCTTEAAAWDDISNGGNGHGTHVTGTILGNGDAQADHTGIAPGLGTWSADQSLFNYRIFPNPCSVSLSSIVNTMNTPVGTGTVPHVVNNSWGSTFNDQHVPTGTEADARTVDNHVFNEGQVWVWAAGNYSYQNVGIQATAKNALTVGNTVDYLDGTVGKPGELWSTSGTGPIADNRWKPNVNAPGRWVSSALANNNTGYGAYSGTSMAAPHVTGAIAQLVDHHSWMRDREPAEIAAHLMGTSQAHDMQLLTTASSSHLDTFGTGRINAYRAHWSHSDWTTTTWSPTVGSGNSTYADFTVPVGATRLVAVMHYNEVAGGAGAGTALVNDFDMYLDRAPIDPAFNVGEYSAQQSSVDNTEIRIINNPIAGDWRWKVFPDSTTSSINLGLTIHIISGDITPANTVTITASDSFIKPNDQIDVDVSVSATDFVSAATMLDFDGTSRTIHSKSSTLEDGIVSDLSDSGNTIDYITLGDIRQGNTKNVSYRVSYPSEGTKNVTMQTTSENAPEVNPTVQVIVDGTQPGAVSGLTSPSHTVGQWSNDPTVQWTWNAASDNLSGVAGYGIFETTVISTPGATQDIGAVTSYTSAAYPSSTSNRYFHIRTVDNSGNWDNDYMTDGPYLIDVTDPTDVTYSSSNFPQGSSSCNGTITVNWNASVDSHSGVDGYGLYWTTNPTGLVGQIVDTAGTTSSISPVSGTWYLHVITRDNAGNWSDNQVTFGPFTITPACGTVYCGPANPNSTGFPGVLTASGSDIASENDLTLNASGMPLNNFGYFLGATSQGPPITPPGSQGEFCLGGALGRFNAGGQIRYTGATGAFSLDVPLNNSPTSPAQSVVAGQTWSFQAWHRDQNPFDTSNFTNVITVTFN